MGKVVNPFDAPKSQLKSTGIRDPWSTFIMLKPGTKYKVYVPGVSSVEVSTRIKEDSKPVDGEDGASVTFLGYDGADIKVAVQLWSREQFEALVRVIEIYRPKKDKKPQPVQCIHPKLDLYGITQAYVFDISDQPYNSADGYRLAMTLKQWYPQKKKGKGATGKLGTVIPSVATISTVSSTPVPTNKAPNQTTKPSVVKVNPGR